MALEYIDKIELTEVDGIFRVVASSEKPKGGLYFPVKDYHWQIELKHGFDYSVIKMEPAEYLKPVINADKSLYILHIYKHQIQKIHSSV